MGNRGIGKWAVATIAVAMMLAFGCAKKQTVKSTDTGAAGAGAGAAAGTEKGGGISSESVKPEPAPPESRMAAAEAAAGVAATEEKPSLFQDVHFDFDKATVRPDDRPLLAKVAEYMKQQGGSRLQIEGHCDERGTAEYNMALGDRRAESCKAYLVSLGIKAARLSTVSYGKEKPLDPGHTEDAWAKNRRAHFVLK